MKYPIQLLLLIVFLTTTNTTFSQTVSTIPSDKTNDRFAQEYFSVIRPGLSLNGFDNTGDEPKGLGLKQVLNAALSGNTYLKDKLNLIFNDSKVDLKINNSVEDDIQINSRIVQYTAFEALASYVLEHNNIDSVTSESMGLTIRSHATAVADLRAKLLSISNAGWDNLVTNRDDFVKT